MALGPARIISIRAACDDSGMDDAPASKAEFVWLMLELARRDRALYREVREDGWNLVAAISMLRGKSENPN